jgi:hypothetical protein
VEAVDGRLVERDDDQVAPPRAAQLPCEQLRVAQELGRVVVAALDLDVDRRARERAQHLAQRRDPEIPPRVAARRPAVARPRAAQRVAPRRQPGDRVAPRHEEVRRVEPPDLGEREVGQVAVAVRRAVDRPVVHHHEPAVTRAAHVELEHVRAAAHRARERVHRVRRELRLAALVGDVHHAVVAQPGGARRRRERGQQDERDEQRAGHQFCDGSSGIVDSSA